MKSLIGNELKQLYRGDFGKVVPCWYIGPLQYFLFRNTPSNETFLKRRARGTVSIQYTKKNRLKPTLFFVFKSVKIRIGESLDNAFILSNNA